MGIPYRIVVEEQQYDAYAAFHDPATLLVLDPEFQRDYETCDDIGDALPPGAGAARNFIWWHSMNDGHEWHWTMDDNIDWFKRYHQNLRVPCLDATPFVAMEDFTTRYTNVAMAGPNYVTFIRNRQVYPPYATGTRIYSCNLIRNDVPQRWRGRWNEDTILSLDLLKAGWATIQFNAFLQQKLPTQRLKGGNTDTLYAEGTYRKSQMLVAVHPDVTKLTYKFGRYHHHVDYSRWRNQPLIKDPTWIPTGRTWNMTVVDVPDPSPVRPRRNQQRTNRKRDVET